MRTTLKVIATVIGVLVTLLVLADGANAATAIEYGLIAAL